MCASLAAVGAPSGFRYERRSSGEVVIFHRSTVATVLRGPKAPAFLDEVAGATSDEAQELMARLTGNYKRGNERLAAQHPRNRRR